MWASKVVQVVKNLPANAGDIRDAASIPGLGDPLEKEMATHTSILAWGIPCTEEAGVAESQTRLNSTTPLCIHHAENRVSCTLQAHSQSLWNGTATLSVE